MAYPTTTISFTSSYMRGGAEWKSYVLNEDTVMTTSVSAPFWDTHEGETDMDSSSARTQLFVCHFAETVRGLSLART